MQKFENASKDMDNDERWKPACRIVSKKWSGYFFYGNLSGEVSPNPCTAPSGKVTVLVGHLYSWVDWSNESKVKVPCSRKQQ